MNNNEMTEKEIINDFISKMNEEDLNEYRICIDKVDVDGVNLILKKYGYAFIKPISSLISEDNIDDLFGGKEETIIPLLVSSLSDARKKMKENGELSKNSKHIKVGSIEELRRLDDNINNKWAENHYVSAIYNEEVNVIMKAKIILESAGCEYISAELDDIINKIAFDLLLTTPMERIKRKEIISEDRRNAGRGNVSPHKVMAIKIASDTWKEYPNASQEGMVDEIYLYFRKKWNDNPSSGAIKGWLSESGLNPKVKPKNRKFSLIINE